MSKGNASERERAYRAVVAAILDLATARGHSLAEPLLEGGSIAVECRTCRHWLNISIASHTDAPSISGRALATCPGKRWRGVSITDAGLISPATGTLG